MPRDIPVGNGTLLVTFDHLYQIRDLYYPHVGQENHAGAGACRFGVYADIPGEQGGKLAWSCDAGCDAPVAVRIDKTRRGRRIPRGNG